MQISRLVGLSNLSFLNSVSQGSQTDISFTVALFCCRSATRCASPSLQLQGIAESCNLLWPFQKVSSVFRLLQHWVRGSQPARPKAVACQPRLHVPSQKGQKRVSFCTIPVSVVIGTVMEPQPAFLQPVILAVSGSVRSKWHLRWAPVSQRESLRLETGHTEVSLMSLVHWDTNFFSWGRFPLGRLRYPAKPSSRLYLSRLLSNSILWSPNFPHSRAVLISPALVWFLLLLIPPTSVHGCSHPQGGAVLICT